MIPLWLHLSVVLTLVGIQVVQGIWFMRRNSDLRDALEMREILLGRDSTSVCMVPQDTLNLKDKSGSIVCSITSSGTTMLTVSR